MAPDINWPLWLLTMIPLIFSAGPGNIMVAASGARSGFKGSFRFIWGLDITYFVLAVGVGLGLADLLRSYPTIESVLRIFGVGYIAYLATRFLRAPKTCAVTDKRSFGLLDGMLVQITNVKGVIILIVMFSEFAHAGSFHNVVLLSAALVMLNLLSHILWAGTGSAINRMLERNPLLLRSQNMVFAAMLLGCAVWIAFR